MNLNAKALAADNEARKPSARQNNEGEKEDSVVTPTKPSKKPSPPFLLRKRAPMGSALLGKDPEEDQEEVVYDQEHSKPRNVPCNAEVHKNLLPVELKGFSVHMKVSQDQQVLKHIKEGCKEKAEDATDLDLILTQSMEKKVMWFQMHLDSICPVHCLPDEALAHKLV